MENKNENVFNLVFDENFYDFKMWLMWLFLKFLEFGLSESSFENKIWKYFFLFGEFFFNCKYGLKVLFGIVVRFENFLNSKLVENKEEEFVEMKKIKLEKLEEKLKFFVGNVKIENENKYIDFE